MHLNSNLSSLLPPDFEYVLRDALLAVSGGLVLLFIAAAFAFVGWLVALALSRAIQALLALVGVDSSVARLRAKGIGGPEMLPSRVAGYMVFWSVFLGSCVVALRVVGLDLVPSITARIQDVVPRILTSALVLLAGIPLAIGVGRLLGSLLPSGALSGKIRYQVVTSVLIAFITLMALEQLGLAAQLVMAVGIAIVGAVGLALALAFGLGCRDLARDLIVEYLRASDARTGSERS
jgi:hypothetical protein